MASIEILGQFSSVLQTIRDQHEFLHLSKVQSMKAFIFFDRKWMARLNGFDNDQIILQCVDLYFTERKQTLKM